MRKRCFRRPFQEDVSRRKGWFCIDKTAPHGLFHIKWSCLNNQQSWDTLWTQTSSKLNTCKYPSLLPIKTDAMWEGGFCVIESLLGGANIGLVRLHSCWCGVVYSSLLVGCLTASTTPMFKTAICLPIRKLTVWSTVCIKLGTTAAPYG